MTQTSSSAIYREYKKMRAKKILIVDPDEKNLICLSTLLQCKGLEFVTATDGLSGLKMVKSENPDLVISETFLPKFPGFQLCTKIVHDFDRKVPVILLSRHLSGSKFKDEARQIYGASAVFETPYKEEELFSTISALLEEAEKKEIKQEKQQAAPPPKVSTEKEGEEKQIYFKQRDEKGGHKEPLIRIGEYVLMERIGSGGMGEVYKAKKIGSEGFEKTVAIKRIHPHLVEENKEFINMFIDEAKLASQLSHPNIVQIYDFGKNENFYFIVMEYVLGKNLSTILQNLASQNKKMPFPYSAFIAMSVCQALEYAHRKHDSSGRPLDIVHRDICPKNILVSFEGEVKLTDFGIAAATSKIHKTLPGSIKGKISYMSPQQACAKEIDCRADIYSLGSVLYEIVTGEMAFSDDNDIALLNKVQKGIVIPPSKKNTDIPEELDNIILKALEYDLEKRYQNATEFKKDLEEFMTKYYKDKLFTYIDLSQFMIGLFTDELKEKGMLKEIEETRLMAEKKLFEKESPKTPADALSDKGPKKRISHTLLLADDSQIIQKVVGSALKKENINIFSSSDGQHVLDSIEQINPDIILLDINLPKRNGYEVCEMIMNNEKLSDTTVIFLREPFEKIDHKKLKNLTYEEILQKPIKSGELVSKIKKLLQKKENPETDSQHPS